MQRTLLPVALLRNPYGRRGAIAAAMALPTVHGPGGGLDAD